MKRCIYSLGRITQVMALLILPSAIWMAEIRHSEKGAISIFILSVLVFAIGFCLARVASRL